MIKTFLPIVSVSRVDITVSAYGIDSERNAASGALGCISWGIPHDFFQS